MQLEFKAFYCFFTMRVITNYLDCSFITNIIFISSKYDLWRAVWSAESQKATNFIFQMECEIFIGLINHSWSEDKNRGFTIKFCFHILILRSKFGFKVIADRKFGFFVAWAQNHACRQPVGDLKLEWVTVHSYCWLTINPVWNGQDHLDNLFMSLVNSSMSLSMSLIISGRMC